MRGKVMRSMKMGQLLILTMVIDATCMHAYVPTYLLARDGNADEACMHACMAARTHTHLHMHTHIRHTHQHTPTHLHLGNGNGDDGGAKELASEGGGGEDVGVDKVATYIRRYMHVCMNAFIRTRIRKRFWGQTRCLYILTYAENRVRVFLHACMHVWMHVCMYVCYVCVY